MLSLLCLAATGACTAELDAVDPLEVEQSASDGDEPVPLDGDESWLEPFDPPSLTTSPPSLASLACTQDNDCRSACLCLAGACGPNPGVAPQPPSGYCDQPPTRSCSSALDCRDGCSCLGGICAGAVSPQPPDCHLPPPDDYEYDDTWPNWSAYTGSQAHNFHTATDADWTAVFIGTPGLVRFETLGLSLGTDTRLKVFAWDGASNKGPLLGMHDDVGGGEWDPQSKRSRIDLNVGANSAFLVKVVNESDPTIYSTSHTLPSYTLQISYL